MKEENFYTTINFTDEFRNVSVTLMCQRQKCGSLICGWLGVVVARKADLNWKL